MWRNLIALLKCQPNFRLQQRPDVIVPLLFQPMITRVKSSINLEWKHWELSTGKIALSRDKGSLEKLNQNTLLPIFCFYNPNLFFYVGFYKQIQYDTITIEYVFPCPLRFPLCLSDVIFLRFPVSAFLTYSRIKEYVGILTRVAKSSEVEWTIYITR